MTKHDRCEWVEEYSRCPRCENEDIVAFTVFDRLSNEGFDTKFSLQVECDECDSTFKTDLFHTKASTRIVRDPHGL